MATSTDLRAAIEEVQNQLPAEQIEGDFSEAYEADWSTRVERRVGALPWWVISAVVHSVIFLLATLLTVALPAAQTDEVVITSDVAKEKKPEFDPKKKRDIFRNPHEVKADTQVDNPLVVHEKVEDTTHNETENDMDSQTARGSEDAISDIPLGGTGVAGVVGVGGGGMAGVFGYRGGGGRKRAVARFGGSPATESAVLAALLWLKRHQEPDGHWDSKKYGASSYGRGGDVGVTGLALLAFLGAGHTEKTGQFRDNVRRAQAWLIKQQDPKTGELNQKRVPRTARPYNHAMAALALAEAYGMTRNPALREPAQKAVDCVNAWQNPYAGWRYHPKDGDSDPSVTGWMLMVVKSAKIAGLKVDLAAYQGGLKYLNLCTYKKGSKEGKTHYRFGSGGSYGRWQSMTSVSLFCRLLMGYRRTEDLLKKQADWLTSDLPDWDKSKGNQSHNEYYWYYGTLAMFQMGGQHWKGWNTAMKKALLPNQQKGGPRDGSLKDVDGSWDPISTWGKCGGRVYTTAINALSLEVYYRYLPLYNK